MGITRAFACILFGAATVLTVVGSSCSDRADSPFEPTEELLAENGNAAASVWYFDCASDNGRVRLIWRTGRKGWVAWPQYPGEPPPTPPPVVGKVSLLMSHESPETGFTSVVVRENDGPDSAWVEGLVNRRPYYFRLATYDASGQTLLGHSAPLMTTPGPQLTRVHVVATDLPSSLFFTSATWSPDGRQLAFVRPTEEGSNGYEGNICVFDAMTGTERQLTLYDGTEHFLAAPTWSHDGAWIAYYYSPTRTYGGLDYRIWRTSALSFGPMSITDGRIDGDPDWGPEGDLVFCRGTYEPPNIPELWIASSNTWSARQLTFDQLSRKRHPSVNPRTGVIVYADEPLGSLDQHLYAIDPAGGGAYSLTPSRYWVEREPAWAADGTRVVFTSDRSGHYEIWSYDTLSGAYLQLTRGLEEFPSRTAGTLARDSMYLSYREELRYTSRGTLIIAQVSEP